MGFIILGLGLFRLLCKQGERLGPDGSCRPFQPVKGRSPVLRGGCFKGCKIIRRIFYENIYDFILQRLVTASKIVKMGVVDGRGMMWHGVNFQIYAEALVR